MAGMTTLLLATETLLGTSSDTFLLGQPSIGMEWLLRKRMDDYTNAFVATCVELAEK